MVSRFLTALALLFSFFTSFSQWTRVQQLPSSNIFSLFHKDSSLYAGGTNVIYISNNKGLTWNTTAAIPNLSANTSLVNNIIVYRNELYVSAPNIGVFKSLDDGASWLNISSGIFPDVTDFCEYRGDLYAATLGNSVYKLDPVNPNRWLSFGNGLGSISAVATAIAGTNNTLIAGTNANGLYDYLPANSTTWEERFLTNPVSVNEGAFDIITAHDTLFLPGKTGRFYMSTDKGLTWNLFGNRLKTSNTTLVNAKQALVSSIRFFNGTNFLTVFLYIKKDSLQDRFVNFSVVPNHFTWRIDILGDKLWDASDEGLFFMPLSILPGISEADDSMNITLPVNFISFNAKCEESKTLLLWKTAQEQNSRRFDIERSIDGIRWTVVGNLPASGNSSIEHSYSFTDNVPLQNNYYRIAEYDVDGKLQYTNILHSSCNATDAIRLWPNPAHYIVFINVTSANESQAMIKLFDTKGELLKEKKLTVLKGSNQLNMDIGSLPNGIYSLSASWQNGQISKSIKVIKN